MYEDMGHGGNRTAASEGRAAETIGQSSTVRVTVEHAPDFSGGALAAFCKAHASTPFQHPTWLAAFYGRLAPARGAKAHVLVGTASEDGRMLFVVPLIRRRKAGIALLETADLGVSDYAAPIVAPGMDDIGEARDAVARALPAHDILRIRPIREEHRAAWQALLGGRMERLDFSAHATAPDGDYSGWRRLALSDSFARNLERKKKRFLKPPGAGLRRLDDPAEIAHALDTIRTLRAGRFDGDMIQQEAVMHFYADVAVRGAASGLARTYLLTDGSEAVAYVFGLGWQGRFHYLLIGCDYRRFGRHSPGLIVYDMMIEDWSRDGGRVFDFTIGDEPFKSHYGTHAAPMFMLSNAPTWRGRLAVAAAEARHRFDRLRRHGSEREGDSTDA